MKTCFEGNSDIVELLLKHKADVNLKGMVNVEGHKERVGRGV